MLCCKLIAYLSGDAIKACFWQPGMYYSFITKYKLCNNYRMGAIHKIRKQARGRGLAKCLCYYISLCSKLAYKGRRGGQNWQNLTYVVYGCPHVSLLALTYFMLLKSTSVKNGEYKVIQFAFMFRSEINFIAQYVSSLNYFWNIIVLMSFYTSFLLKSTLIDP